MNFGMLQLIHVQGPHLICRLCTIIYLFPSISIIEWNYKRIYYSHCSLLLIGVDMSG